MWDPYLAKFRRGARPFLPEDEEIIAAFVARPRGWTQAVAGGAAHGAATQGRTYAAGERAGLVIASPMALAITRHRLLVLRIDSPIGLGIGGDVEALVSAVALSEVDDISRRWLPLGQVITVTVRGETVILEANVMANVRAVIDAFRAAR
jgi:hypothetical protein